MFRAFFPKFQAPNIEQELSLTVEQHCGQNLAWDLIASVLQGKKNPAPESHPSLTGHVLGDTARLSQRYLPIARYGVLVSQHGQLGAIPPPPFLRVSPLEST